MNKFSKMAAFAAGIGKVTLATCDGIKKFKAREKELKDLNLNLAQNKFFI